jgi:predicted transposase YdaD
MGTLAEKYERGIALGEKRGKLETLKQIVKNMLAKKISVKAIKDFTGLSLKEILELKNQK